jgi:hypothetical protein
MQTMDEITRQMLGCGWAPPPAPELRAHVDAPAPLLFRPTRDALGARVVNVCPGYLVALPEVIEIARAYVHWGKGHLLEFFGGRQPGEAVLVGIEILNGAVGELTTARATPRDQGGIG